MKIEILITFVVALLPLAAVTAQNVTVPDDTAQTDTVPVNTVTADDIADLNGCSYHQYYSCHDEALCIDTADEPGRWKCVCQGDLEGDGLKEGTGCGPRSCRFASECHKLANCTEMAGCECLSGYEGDGWDECRDEDECVDLPCSQYALCENTDGGFRCTCKMQLGYVGDGFTCHHQCSVDYDCGANEKCRAEVCVCAPGYEAGDTGCVDENECEANPCDGNATCVNTIGSFVCTCKNGFAGNGEECKALPRNCHEVKIALPGSRSGKYTIDPDGTGDMDAIEVECEMRPAFGITIVKPIETKHVRYTRRDPNTTYEYTHPVEDIKAIIATSGFCYQEMTYECYQGAQLMDGDDFWVNGNGEKEVNWGGASISGMCACGQLGYCEDRSQACNCDGFPIKRIDAGKVVDKARLPILAVNIHPGDKGYGFVLIGSVMCAPTPFDIPINCHDAKFNPLYNKRKNGPQVLDFDGPDGALDPVLAHCDMETWRHVGVTVIPHSRSQPTTPNSTDPIPLEYVIGTLELNALIDVSTNCMQEAEYECTNSRLMNNGDRRGWWTDINGRNRDSWPGGLGESNKCACAITKTCASDSYGCNCDVMDGNTRKDFGRVYEKTAIGAVTFLDVGGDSRGAFSVGPLMCADREFGIPATCQDYVATGYTDSHTYIVDPDGPAPKGSLDPFPVYCEMTGEPLYAITIIYHSEEFEVTLTSAGQIVYKYLRVTLAQIDALVTRSVTCSQTVKYTCTKAPLHAGGESLVSWESGDGRTMSYFAGDGTSGSVCACGMTEPSSCTGRGDCECDMADAVTRVDEGLLINKKDLPVASLNVTGVGGISGQAGVLVGPLMCKDLFPNCAEMFIFKKNKRLESENSMENGAYPVDPDGEGGVEPFLVRCTSTETTVPVVVVPNDPTDGNPDGPVSKCHEVKYMTNGVPVSPEQVQALVESSEYCAQSLEQQCLNAPVTGHSNFTTCDGQPQSGWSGSRGEEQCACGVTGACAGGPESLCNCDLEDGVQRKDGGWVVNKDRLAVCEVCVSLDSTSSLTSDPKTRRVRPVISDLYCGNKPTGRGKTCQQWRDEGKTESEALMIDPDGSGPLEPVPVHCVLQTYPPAGWTEIIPKTPEIEVPEEGTNVTVEYYVYEMKVIYELIARSRYCTQELVLHCVDSGLELGGVYGWYSQDGVVQESWAGNNEGTPGCAGGECQCNLAGLRKDGGNITDGSLLPVSRVVLGPAPGTRTMKIGAVKCFDVYRDCEDIRANNARTNPLRNNVYAIDPDMSGEVEMFAATCDFITDKDIGITVIPIRIPEDTSVRYRVEPGSYKVSLVYDGATHIQIHTLATISGFCHQGIQYVCYKSPLINGNSPAQSYYTTYGGASSPSWGVAGHPDVSGCACMATGTCPPGHSCHCDSMGSMTVDYGHETDRQVMPIEQLNFGGQLNDSSALFDVTDVRCAPKPFDLPEDCQDAYERGSRTGEHLIWPSTEVEPFLVYCDMDILPDGGVTIIGHDRESGSPVTFNVTEKVTYKDADDEQVEAVTDVSNFCYQPFRYECQNTRLLSRDGYFTWIGGLDNAPQSYVGSGRPFAHECNCGLEGLCGGSEDKETLKATGRACNCDAADDVLRADAGVFNSSVRLPVRELTFTDPELAGAYGYLVLGRLYCSKQDFDINECRSEFHDCHDHASCINTHGAYDCYCKPGWRGLGRPDVWANGRNCYDDDECAMNQCPWSADCENLPGTFECTCKPGFRQLGPRKCEDIDECAEGTHECHANARCFNLAGSYDCRCDRNFRGDGFTCEPLALCTCFGDPHCITYDTRLITYQGTCQYVMARDTCDDYDTTPSFEVLVTFETRGKVKGPASWVKEVTFNIYDYSILLLAGGEVRINGRTVNLPYRQLKVNIAKYGKYVVVYTDIGVEVSWNGQAAVEVHTPGTFANTTCGLCGNYNGDPADDLTVGPQCPDDEGKQAENVNRFGNSWVVPAWVAENPECASDCSAPPDPGLCNGTNLEQAKFTCDKIWDTNGPFQECISGMDETAIEMYYTSCLYDMCQVDGDIEGAFCNAAETLVDTCLRVYKSPVKSFRSKGFCEHTCGENMEYKICGPLGEPTCADFRSGTTPGENGTLSGGDTDGCHEGCFCKEGYMLDGEDCVPEEECGCVFNDQYYSVGDEFVVDGCGSRSVCQPGGNMPEEGVTCHENATCDLQDGRYGCHCRDGFYGDGVHVCVEDPCDPDPCGENEVCIRTPETDKLYVCQCEMGYEGDCGNCTEIDECLTATDTCPQNARCINTEGSFECECFDGFIMSAGQCDDVDECKLASKNTCGNNSKCSNKPGGFECPCCAGFEKDDNGECVATEGPGAANSPVCCVCDAAICDEPGKVCGEDGVTYDSIRDMVISNCEAGRQPRNYVTIDYKGRCKDSCSNVDCPLYQNCVKSEETGKPTCVCDPCTATEVESEEKVCSSSLVIYPNMCVFKQIQCMMDWESVPESDLTPCEEAQGESPVGPWSDWGPCSVTCGKGESSRTRPEYRPGQPYDTVQTEDCYEDPCPDGPCFNFDCNNVAAECVVNDEGDPECECPKCTDIGVDEVCGYVSGVRGGAKPGTWQSECHLRKFACEMNVPDFEVMHPGVCGVKPLNCTRVPHMEVVHSANDTEYRSLKSVQTFACEGGCGHNKDQCCQASKTEGVTVIMKNLVSDLKEEEVQIIRECECVEIENGRK
ncbi:uncharacterized protein LOC128234628 [Mya arenaria]|uniref:uncharacterized protein LOC128234628 n=1 Tax=Mya arenaria TaxID=6604 RepID=UPI0022E871E7|nr:uncharacterized protein LOC128234628 [Mya arenaria]